MGDELKRTHLAKVALAAWVNVPVDQLPQEKMWIEHPCDLNRQAWDRVVSAVLDAARAQGPGPGEAVASISTDGPHEISNHRRWLARQLLDSQLSDTEAFGIVANSPAMIAATPTRDAR